MKGKEEEDTNTDHFHIRVLADAAIADDWKFGQFLAHLLLVRVSPSVTPSFSPFFEIQ